MLGSIFKCEVYCLLTIIVGRWRNASSWSNCEDLEQRKRCSSNQIVFRTRVFIVITFPSSITISTGGITISTGGITGITGGNTKNTGGITGPLNYLSLK